MKILIVEDEKIMVEMLRQFLQPIASEISATDDLQVALSLVKNDKFDVVIQDLKLVSTGIAEGIAAISIFKRSSVAVVVVSGQPDPDLKDKVLSAGADAFVPKDRDFSTRAMLMAIQVATRDFAGRSASFEASSEVLQKICAGYIAT